MKKAISLLFLMLFFTVGDSFGQSTFQFLKLDVSARTAALGGSFVSNNDDPDVIFYNPAGLGLLKENPASFSFMKFLLDINMASLSYSTDIKNVGRVGAGVKYINYGSFQQTDESGNITSNCNYQEVAFVAGYSNLLDKNFYYGANAKFIFSHIADRSSSAIALDLGLQLFTKSPITLSISVLPCLMPELKLHPIIRLRRTYPGCGSRCFQKNGAYAC